MVIFLPFWPILLENASLVCTGPRFVYEFSKVPIYHPRFPDSRAEETDARTGCKADYALQLTLFPPTPHPHTVLPVSGGRPSPVPAPLSSPQSMLIPSVLLCDWITWDTNEIAPREDHVQWHKCLIHGSCRLFGSGTPPPSSPSPSPSPFTYPRHLAYRFHGRLVLHLRSSGLLRPVISRMWKGCDATC